MEDQRAADAWRWSVFRWAWLRAAVWSSVGFAVAWGLSALVWRAASDRPPTVLTAALPAVVLLWLAAAWWARRQVPDRASAMALLDRVNRRGGLLMVGHAAGREAWEARDAAAPRHRPAVRWRAGPGLGSLATATVFAAAALLVPMPGPRAARAAMDVAAPLDTLGQQVGVLEQQRVWEPPEADRARSAMKQIDRQATAQDPAKTWEALDHLRQRVERDADEAASLAQDQRQQAETARAVAEALREGGDTADPTRLAEAMQALGELARAAEGEADPAQDPSSWPEGLGRALADAGLGDVALSPEMLEQLSQAMAERSDTLREMLETLSEAQLAELPPHELADLASSAEISSDELMEYLNGDGACDAAGLMGLCQGDRPGRGGISRGPGHAEMTWQDPASREGVSFDPELLPPSAHRDAAQSYRLALRRSDAQDEPEGVGSRGGALSDTPAAGGSADTAVVLPRHRDAVQRYFDRAADSAD